MDNVTRQYLDHLIRSEAYSDVLAGEVSPETMTKEQKRVAVEITELRLMSRNTADPRFQPIRDAIDTLYPIMRSPQAASEYARGVWPGIQTNVQTDVQTEEPTRRPREPLTVRRDDQGRMSELVGKNRGYKILRDQQGLITGLEPTVEPFTGADTGVGVPEMQPSPLSKGAPVGTYGPPTKVPSLPSLPVNLEELRAFTGWNEPGFLESLLGASGWKAHTVDVALKALNAPFEAMYNLIQNIPVKTEGEQAAREALARATYIGALLYAPGDLGLFKGVKALNRAAREAKEVGEVARRAAEIARGQ